MSQFVAQFEKLYRHAVDKNDVMLHQMIETFLRFPENWESWEDFLVDVVLALSTANSTCRENLLQALCNQSRPVIMLSTDDSRQG